MPSKNSDSGVTILELGDDENKKILKQIAIGGVSGWLTGFVSMKVGKVAATAIGGALIILQVANHKGYIKINWSRVNRDVEKVKTKLQEEATGKKADWTEKVRGMLQDSTYGTLEKKLEAKTTEIVGKQRRWFHSLVGKEDEDRVVTDVALYTGSFVLGFGLGVITGN
ncbi:unnamed protein product [Allacma fusca]|uniref:FUN14 domain-containing protein 1 n=1 Tax=Allacma fusca TaxID=39272 RepID=A0A8J2LJH1_9HEXA|nr:unnamed protein product [Allacma fusca]